MINSSEHYNPLIFKAMIDEQGVLTAKLPNALRGKTVTISVQIAYPEPQETLLDIFAQADQLTFPRRQHTEILDELHALRGST